MGLFFDLLELVYRAHARVELLAGMGQRLPNEGAPPPGVLRRLQVIADKQGVSLEALIETIRARRFYRRARYQRRVAKARTARDLRRTPDKQARLYAGEGELHAQLKAARLTAREFCDLVGMSTSTFYRWYGHPLHRWPIEFLRLYSWGTKMAEFLTQLGWDPSTLRPTPPPSTTAGQYPRKVGDLVIASRPRPDYSPWKTKKAS